MRTGTTSTFRAMGSGSDLLAALRRRALELVGVVGSNSEAGASAVGWCIRRVASVRGANVTWGSLVVVTRGRDVLLVRNRYVDRWGFVGGIPSRSSEQPRETAAREAWEEVNLIVEPSELEVVGVLRQQRAAHLDVVFAVEIDDAWCPILDEAELIEFRWLTTSDAGLLLDADDQAILDLAVGR